MDYKVKLEVFEGPLDLLLHLIEKEKIDIYDIPIAKVTEQYLEYIKDLPDIDLEVASEFIVMAATLLAIKARMLLPSAHNDEEKQEILAEGEDPREELVTRLIEYKKYKAAAGVLQQRAQDQAKIFMRLNDSLANFLPEDYNPVEGITLDDLFSALHKILRDAREDAREIARDEVTVREKIQLIVKKLTAHPHGLYFRSLFGKRQSKIEIIVTFLALLELIRLRKVRVCQDDYFGEIFILPSTLLV